MKLGSLPPLPELEVVAGGAAFEVVGFGGAAVV